MNIDRHNYEEYFLLYIDNELNVDQKKQVELFVRENPDLEEELVMLKQSRLIPDDSVVFDKKHLLMKEDTATHSFINLSNYEQWLIMYVDDELSAEEKLAVEKFASTHEHVQQELELFQQTKLKPEEIVFANKEALYRSEGSVRIIRMQWWKIAVAAMLIIGAGVTLYSVLHKNNIDSGITPNTVAVNKNERAPDLKKVEPSINHEQTLAASEEGTKHQETGPLTNEKVENKNSQLLQDKPQFADKLSLPDMKKTLAKSSIITNTPDRIVSDEFKNATVEEPKKSDVAVLENELHKGNINSVDVTNHIAETPDNGSEPDNATQYASNAENKKFRGFFRKATRILERTANINAADDDKVLIGGMAINLK